MARSKQLLLRPDWLPAVALSARTRPEDRIEALSAGFQMHVAKPVVPAELLAVAVALAGPGRLS